MTTLRDRIEATVKQYLSTTDEAYATSIPILTDRLEALFAEERARIRKVVDGMRKTCLEYHSSERDCRITKGELFDLLAALQPPTDTPNL